MQACDTVAEGVRSSLRQCVRVAKQGAEAAGIDPSRFRHWWSDGYGNPFYDVAVFIAELGEKALPLVVLFYTLALRKTLKAMSEAQLIRAYWNAYDAETICEGVENAAKEAFPRTGDLRAIREAMRTEAVQEFKTMAVIDEMLERGITHQRIMLG